MVWRAEGLVGRRIARTDGGRREDGREGGGGFLRKPKGGYIDVLYFCRRVESEWFPSVSYELETGETGEWPEDLQRALGLIGGGA